MQVKYFPPQDTNFDDKVDMQDFAKVAAYWQTDFSNGTGVSQRTAYSPMDNSEYYADINNNGSVGLEDLAMLSEGWLWQKPAYDIDEFDPINPPAPEPAPVEGQNPPQVPFSKAYFKPKIVPTLKGSNEPALVGDYLQAYQEEAFERFVA